MIAWLRERGHEMWCLAFHWTRTTNSYASSCDRCNLIWW